MAKPIRGVIALDKAAGLSIGFNGVIKDFTIATSNKSAAIYIWYADIEPGYPFTKFTAVGKDGKEAGMMVPSALVKGSMEFGSEIQKKKYGFHVQKGKVGK